VKIAPDVSEDDLQDIAVVVTQSGIDGVIATNTTVAR
jgi:dihydroorotate dehydrogenase